MRRRTLHGLFGTLAAVLAIATAVSATHLARDSRVNHAIASAGTLAPADRVVPEARYAVAVQLAASAPYDTALAAEKAFLLQAPQPLRESMQYDLGNLHLREALRARRTDPTAGIPLVELAKQSYRDALRANPHDWDARYNLERALALAPEADEANTDDSDPPANKERTVTTAKVERKELP
ncbi:MAG TPA: MxaK protein, partial [Burkholderiaceae bacterium]|nr:MxaK protein [Burkholderiaceae bacterium]